MLLRDFSHCLPVHPFLTFCHCLQLACNMIAYKHKPRLRTALELLKTTQEIEQKLEKVCKHFSVVVVIVLLLLLRREGVRSFVKLLYGVAF